MSESATYRDLSLEEQQAAVRQRIAERQKQFGFPVTDPAELYRSPSADNPDEVMALGGVEPQELDDAAQIEWAERNKRRNTEAFRTAVEHAAPPLPAAQPATDLRAALQDAIDAYNAAAVVADAADVAVERAKQQMQEADAAVAAYDGLDDHITAHAIDCVRDGKPVTLPHHLKAAQMQRTEAMERSRTLHSIHGQLLSEAQAGRVAVEKAAARRNTAASHILYARADRIASDLAAMQDCVERLGNELRSIGDTWLVIGNGSSRSVGLSSHAREVLLRPRDEPRLDQEYSASVQRWFVALQTDATAEVDE